MTVEILAWVALGLAALPCALFLLNLSVYRPLPPRESRSGTRPGSAVSVLIPARNEEANLPRTLAAVLAEHDCALEVIVLDDHSTDRTAQIVGEVAARDARLRLVAAPPLPPGWCGKQHACAVLARLARYPLLLFLDADVRLTPGALKRMAQYMDQSGVALASGVPRQALGTFSERLLLPLIHFILLGFLPMRVMQRSRRPELSAGCGQLFIARREAYQACGGHAQLRLSLHDGLQLPRVFRRAGFATGLFDATDLALCRMYHTNLETWRGLGKNATEGLAAPRTIGPMTALLLGGQVLPFVGVGCAPLLPASAAVCAAAAALLAWLPRFIAARKFRQPWVSAVLHPLGVLALLGIQWQALVRHWLGRPAEWKGRRYTRAQA